MSAAQSAIVDGPETAHRDTFRAAMGNLASGVAIVTAGRGDTRRGLTASSVTSLSLDPPSILVCINRRSSIGPVLEAERSFAVNILAEEHRQLAERFAGRSGVSGAERFAFDDWISLTTGAPILAGALTAVDCEVERLIDWHSHMIVIGGVRGVYKREAGQPLVYWQGGFIRAGL